MSTRHRSNHVLMQADPAELVSRDTPFWFAATIQQSTNLTSVVLVMEIRSNAPVPEVVILMFMRVMLELPLALLRRECPERVPEADRMLVSPSPTIIVLEPMVTPAVPMDSVVLAGSSTTPPPAVLTASRTSCNSVPD